MSIAADREERGRKKKEKKETIIFSDCLLGWKDLLPLHSPYDSRLWEAEIERLFLLADD